LKYKIFNGYFDLLKRRGNTGKNFGNILFEGKLVD